MNKHSGEWRILDSCIRGGPQRIPWSMEGLWAAQSAGAIVMLRIEDGWFAVHTQAGFDLWDATQKEEAKRDA